LPYAFLCPKCGIAHSIKEYTDNNFCRVCGKFLSYRNRIVVKKRNRYEKNLEWPLFPYKPYTQQLEFMKDIKAIVGNQGILIAEACNGFGKTVSALASLLPIGHKIVYVTRTHEQVRQVLLEVERINHNSESTFSAVNLASRQHLCLNEKCRNLSALDASEACRLLNKAKQCQYKKESGLSSFIPNVLSIQKLRSQGRVRNVCPYFLARRVAENCTLIVAPYQYIFNEKIRSSIKLELNNRILVFDEAHNADKISQDVLSDTLSERSLNIAKKELEKVRVSNIFIDDLEAYLRRKVSKKIVTESGFKLHEELKDVLKVNKLTSFTDSLSDVVDKIRNYKVDMEDYPACYLNGILNFLSLVESSPSNSYVAIFKRTFYGFNIVEYRCLDPSLAVKPIIEEAYGSLIMSGTLSPIQFFTEILELEKAQTRTYTAIANPENIHTIIDTSVTTRFSERTEKMIQRFGERLSQLIVKIPNGVLIFFPQRKFMLDSLKVWRKVGIIIGSEAYLTLKGKNVFIEGAKADENRRVVEKYKKSTKSENGAVLCGVFRGRNAEGSNFPYEEARGIFLIGVPYANYSDPVMRAQIQYLNEKKNGMGEKWYTMDAFRAANQAMGRGIRHRDDWCNFILMDKRYQKHKHLISKWILSNSLQKIPNELS
jgi:DNA excision repair protein ERCC-2